MATSANPVNLTTTLDELASKLDDQGRQVEAGLRTRWNRTRKEQGRILRGYQELYKPLRLWTKFLALIGLPEKTAYRLMEDADAVGLLPSEVVHAAERMGFDLSKRKFRPQIEQIRQILESDGSIAEETITQLLGAGTRSNEDQWMQEFPYMAGEKRHFMIRMGIRKTLIGIEPNRKIQLLIPALEEEMYDVWRLTEPVTITLTPHQSKLTPLGRKREEAA